MSNTYKIGGSIGPIAMEADINTIGLAASRAIVLDVAGTDNGTAVAHSVDATGDISKQSIGDFKSLKGKRLSVFTKIALTGSDANARKTEANNLTGTYALDGGDDGFQSYNNPIKTIVDPNVFLNFLIDFQ